MKIESKILVGIDWSRANHQVNVFNDSGQVIVRFSVEHTR